MALEKSLSKKERCYNSGVGNRAQAAFLQFLAEVLPIAIMCTSFPCPSTDRSVSGITIGLCLQFLVTDPGKQ